MRIDEVQCKVCQKRHPLLTGMNRRWVQDKVDFAVYCVGCVPKEKRETLLAKVLPSDRR